MHDNLKLLVRIIIKNSDLHGRWLNTFSYLEYIGFRKIVKSQDAEKLDLKTLGHAVEEGRHALLLRKLAVNLGGPKLDTYMPDTLLCGREAESYFQTLDGVCEEHLKVDVASALRARLTYLYVTWLVELRAISVYEIYQDALSEIGEKFPLTGLLAEEDLHLQAVRKELCECDKNWSCRGEELKIIEEELYQNYILALSREILGTETSVEVFA